MNTIPFGPRNPPEDPLLAKAAELPKEIEPAHDLWPGIAARLAEAPRESRPRVFRLAGRARGGIRGRLGLGAADLGPVAGSTADRGGKACRRRSLRSCR